MTTLKSIILGSAAVLLASGAASAADLPVKAKAVEYMKVCSLYGAGFYYIPGTDTCIKIGGAARLDTTFNGGTYDTPLFAGVGASGTRARDNFTSRARFGFNVDSRTNTEYGMLRTFANTQMQWTDSKDTIAGGDFVLDFGFIQFAGFTMGKAVSAFDTQWVLAQPTISSGLVGGSDDKTGILQFAYTAEFGNGFSSTISLEAPRVYRRGGVYDVNDAFGVPGISTATNSEAGSRMPDVVGNVRLDQTWGSLHFGAALHEVAMSYNGLTEATGHYDSKYGYALSGGFEIKNLPTGVNDTLRADFTYAHGASTYVFGGSQNTNRSGYGMFGQSGLAGAYQSIGFGQYADAYFGSPGGAGVADLQLSTDIGARIFYEHYWSPTWRTSLFGTIARHENTGTANGMLLAKLNAGGALGVGSSGAVSGDLNFTVWQIGTRTAWSPIKNLTFSAEVIYTKLETGLSGTLSPAAGYYANKPSGPYEVKNQGTISGAVQAVRSF